MSDEKKIKTDELSDEQMDKVTGGVTTYGDPAKKPRKCANPTCNTYLPYNYPSNLCKKCLESAAEDSPVPSGFQAPDGIFPGKR